MGRAISSRANRVRSSQTREEDSGENVLSPSVGSSAYFSRRNHGGGELVKSAPI